MLLCSQICDKYSILIRQDREMKMKAGIIELNYLKQSLNYFVIIITQREAVVVSDSSFSKHVNFHLHAFL